MQSLNLIAPSSSACRSGVQTINDIHNILKAYYKAALKRYTDNVVIQIV